MPNSLFISAILYTHPDNPTISLSISAVVRSDPETAAAQNAAAFISENPGWKVSLVQCVPLPQDFLQDALAAIAKDGNVDGATVLRLVPSAPKRRGRRPKKVDIELLEKWAGQGLPIEGHDLPRRQEVPSDPPEPAA